MHLYYYFFSATKRRETTASCTLLGKWKNWPLVQSVPRNEFKWPHRGGSQRREPKKNFF